MEGLTYLHNIDFLVIAGYFLVIVLAGTYFSKYIKQAKDYFTAGANIPWWLAAISFWMAGFSSLGFVTYSELGYKYGITTLTLYWVSIPGLLLGAWLFVGRWRRARQMSPIGFIETRFQPHLKQVFVWTGFPLRMIDNSIKIYATAIFLTAALAVDSLSMTRIIWLTGIVTVAYSFLGGQWSVIVTDFVQFIILCLAVVFVFSLSLGEVSNFNSFAAQVPEGFFKPLQPPYDFYQFLTWIVLVFFSYNAGWTLIQKYNCVRSERDARRLVYAVAFWCFIGPIIFYTPALIARVVIPGMENPRFSYAFISMKVLPVGMLGVMIAAMFSATLSTLGNEYSTLSSVLTNDFYARKIRRDSSEQHLVLAGRVNTVIIGVLTTLLAILFQYIKGMNLFDIMVKAFTAFAPAIMTPLLGGILVKRLNSRGTLIGIVAGFVSGSVLLILNIILVGIFKDQFLTNSRLNYWLNQGWSSTSIIINFGVTIAGLWLGSILSKTSEDERRRTDEFFARLSEPYTADTDVKTISPFPVIGVIVMILGAGMLVISLLVMHLFNNTEWGLIDLAASLILLVLGGLIRIASTRRNKISNREIL